MKVLKYKKINCELCDCGGRIITASNATVPFKDRRYEYKSCPLCDGKGYLSILIMEK